MRTNLTLTIWRSQLFEIAYLFIQRGYRNGTFLNRIIIHQSRIYSWHCWYELWGGCWPYKKRRRLWEKVGGGAESVRGIRIMSPKDTFHLKFKKCVFKQIIFTSLWSVFLFECVILSSQSAIFRIGWISHRVFFLSLIYAGTNSYKNFFGRNPFKRVTY